LLLGLIFVVGVSAASVVPVTPISANIRDAYTASINAHDLTTDDLKKPSLTYDVVSSKDLLKIPVKSNEKSNVCSQVASKLASVTDHTELFYLSKVAAKLDCKVTLSSTSRETLNAAIAADYAAESFHGVSSLFSLASLSSPAASIHDYDVLDIVRMFKDLQLPDGTTRAGVSTIGSSIEHTGAALQVLSLALGDATLSASVLPLAKDFIHTAEAATARLCAAPALPAADTLVAGLLALSRAVESVVDVNLNCLVPVLSAQASARRVPVVAAAMRLATALTAPAMHNPFFITHATNGAVLAVSVANALGAPVPAATYTTTATLDGITLAAAPSARGFALPTLTPGSHALVVSAAATAQPVTGTHHSTSVSTALRAPHTTTVSKLVLSGSSSRSAVAAPLLTLSPPFAPEEYSVDAEHARFLVAKLAFATSAPSAPAFALRLTPRHNKDAPAVFPLTPVSASAASLALELAHTDVQALLSGPGVYDVTLEYTSRHAVPVTMPVAHLSLLNVQTARAPVDAAALPTPIAHTFAPEQRVPSSVLALIGSVAVAAPLVILLLRLVKSRPTPVTMSAAEKPAAGLFLASLAACLGLVIVYWTSMSLLAVIPAAAVAATTLAFTGVAALRRSAERRGCAVVETASVEKKTE
jgi:hypothetical protein